MELKINKTLHWQESRKYPSLMQRLLADDVMRKRWRLKVEAAEYAPYEASDELSVAA